jgi:hypothetical protein
MMKRRSILREYRNVFEKRKEFCGRMRRMEGKERRRMIGDEK